MGEEGLGKGGDGSGLVSLGEMEMIMDKCGEEDKCSLLGKKELENGNIIVKNLIVSIFCFSII